MDEMIHGTPSQPDIDGGPIDQDEGGNVPWWWWILPFLLGVLLIYMGSKYPGSFDGSGNLTR